MMMNYLYQRNPALEKKVIFAVYCTFGQRVTFHAQFMIIRDVAGQGQVLFLYQGNKKFRKPF